jgi:hypothetical protein
MSSLLAKGLELWLLLLRLMLLLLLLCRGPPAKPALGPLLRRRLASSVDAPGTNASRASRRMRVPSIELMTSWWGSRKGAMTPTDERRNTCAQHARLWQQEKQAQEQAWVKSNSASWWTTSILAVVKRCCFVLHMSLLLYLRALHVKLTNPSLQFLKEPSLQKGAFPANQQCNCTSQPVL